MKSADWLTAAGLLSSGAVGVIPTDTLYGFSALVSHPQAIDRIYEIKGRSPGNPLVLLAASLDQIADTFPVLITSYHQEVIDGHSDHPTSVIYDLDPDKRGNWQLHNSSKDDLAIRIPYGKTELLELLEEVGPIVSTSTNRQGEPSMLYVKDIVAEFGNEIDFMIDMGECLGPASRIIKIESGGRVKILRDK